MTDKKPIFVFDLDGTLVNTKEDLLDSLNYCLQKQGITKIPSRRLSNYIGHGGRAMIERALEEQGKPQNSTLVEAMLADFMTYYADHIPGKSHYFNGLQEVLKEFSAKNFVFAICTNKAEILARKLINALNKQCGIPCPFAAIRGGDSFTWKKPDPRHIFSVIEEAGGNPDRAVMIGDSAPDIIAAKAADIPSIAVAFGYSDVPIEQLGATKIIKSYDEMTVDLVNELLDRKR